MEMRCRVPARMPRKRNTMRRRRLRERRGDGHDHKLVSGGNFLVISDDDRGTKLAVAPVICNPREHDTAIPDGRSCRRQAFRPSSERKERRSLQTSAAAGNSSRRVSGAWRSITVATPSPAWFASSESARFSPPSFEYCRPIGRRQMNFRSEPDARPLNTRVVKL